MSVGTFNQPAFASQDGTTYKTSIDNSISAMSRIGDSFAPHEQASPNMTVRLDAGALFVSGALVEVAAQSTGTITAPVTNPRIDRVVIDQTTGAVSVITGSEAGSPSAPAITAGKIPICQLALATTTTTITNSLITDERLPGLLGGSTNSDIEQNEQLSEYDVVASDHGKLINCTGTFPVNLLAAANFEDKWMWIKKSGAGVITITANGAEKIYGPGDSTGATTFVLQGAMDCVLLQCDGTDYFVLAITGGAGTVVATENPSGETSVTFSGLTPGKRYKLIGRVLQASSGAQYYIRFNADTGSNYKAIFMYYAGTSVTAADGSGTYIVLYNNIINGQEVLLDIEFQSWLSDNTKVNLNADMVQYSGATMYGIKCAGYYDGAADLSSVTFLISAGTITGALKLIQVD